MINILFVCSRNQWRSPTGETIFKNREGVNVRSAGTEPSARVRVNEKTLNWADIVFVMEQKHKKRLVEMFPYVMSSKKVVVLDIPDEYQYMDAELVEMIEETVNVYI